MKDTKRGFTPALGFHALTPLYDRVVAMTTRERTFKQALLDQSAIGAGDEVLDVGCGTGTLAIEARRRQPGARVSALDADPAVLAIATSKARRAGAGMAFDLGRSSQLPYADHRFDRVLSSLFLHHLSWGDKLLTAPNAGDDSDAALFAKLGLTALRQEEPMRVCKAVEPAE